MDEKDLKLLAELVRDSDRPQKTLCALIGINESELTRRKRRMLDQGIIQKYTVMIDHEKAGYGAIGYFIFSEVEKTREKSEDLVKFLNKIDQVIEINQVFGKDLDFVLKLSCRNNAEFLDVIGQIRDHPNVRGDTSYSAIIATINKHELAPRFDIESLRSNGKTNNKSSND